MLSIVCLIGLLSASSVNAGMMSSEPPELTITLAGPAEDPATGDVGPGDIVQIANVPGDPVAGEESTFSWAGAERGDLWQMEWEVTGDPDPFLNAVFTITNLAPTPQDFTQTVSMPVTPINIATIMGGSVSLTVIDQTLNNGNPPSIGTDSAANAMYTALVDGVPVQTLLNAPQSFVGTTNGTTAFGPADFGVPIPSAPGPSPVTTDIEIELNSRVSAGDTAVLVATFVIEAVPEPAGFSLFGLGALALAGLGRRWRS
jgi:hypothetical protein